VPDTAAVNVAPTPARIAPEMAYAVAQAVDPNAKLLRDPELVMYENTVAYEYVFDMGTIYVQASDGAIVYNGIAVMLEAQRQADAAAAAAAANPPSTNHRDDDGEDHEDHDDHDDHHEDDRDGGDDD
jgi:hypothetical protein